MAPQARSIAQNTTLLSAAYIFQKICAFLYFTALARVLGADSIGKYAFAVSFTTLFSILIDSGLTSVFIRETAKEPAAGERYLSNIVTVKVISSVTLFCTMVASIGFLHRDPIVYLMTVVAGIPMILDSFTLSFWGALRARQNLQYEAVGISINQIIIVAVGISAVVMHLPLYWLIIALTAGSAYSFVYSWTLMRRRLGYRLRFMAERPVVKKLFVMALPFALAGLFTRVYGTIDHILLSLLIGDAQLGWYSVAYKITFAFQFVPAAVGASLYPAMSALYARERGRLAHVFEQSMTALFVAAVPIAIGVGVLADKLIPKIYTAAFMPTVLVLQIMIGTVIVLFISYPVGALLNACDRQAVNTAHMAATMLLNILLNIVLIPQYHQVGAAAAAIISWTLLVILNWSQVGLFLNYNLQGIVSKYLRALIAGAGMAFCVIAAAPFGLVAQIVAGLISYPVLAYLVGAINRDDITRLRGSMKFRYEEDTPANT